MSFSDDARLRWLRWWCIDSWLTADKSWRYAAFYDLDEARLSALARTHHKQICQQLKLGNKVAPVDAEILAWLELTMSQRQLAMLLAAEVCWRDCALALLEPTQQRWCRRIAQGLRPGLWLTQATDLPASCPDLKSLWLLRLRAGPECWQRLRLAFNAERVNQMEKLHHIETFPERLRPLWQAVLWYARQECPC